MLRGDVVDQLLDQHRLAEPGAAEQADLAAADERAIRSTTLSPSRRSPRPRSTNSGGSRWIGQRSTSSPIGSPLSTGSPITLKIRPSVGLADRHADRRAGVHTSTPRGMPSVEHRHGPHPVVAQMLLHLGDQLDRVLAVALWELDPEGVVDLGEVVGEDGVDDDALISTTSLTFVRAPLRVSAAVSPAPVDRGFAPGGAGKALEVYRSAVLGTRLGGPSRRGRAPSPPWRRGRGLRRTTRPAREARVLVDLRARWAAESHRSRSGRAEAAASR